MAETKRPYRVCSNTIIPPKDMSGEDTTKYEGGGCCSIVEMTPAEAAKWKSAGAVKRVRDIALLVSNGSGNVASIESAPGFQSEKK